MKNKLLLSVLLVLVTFWSSCFLKRYRPDSLPVERLEFGQGGGVTGAVKEYTLLPNGQLFVHNSLNNYYLELERLRPRVFKQARHTLDSLRFLKYDFYFPGNVYAFLRYSDEEVEHEITWDPYGYRQPEKGFTGLYEHLMRQVQNRQVVDTFYIVHPDSVATSSR